MIEFMKIAKNTYVLYKNGQRITPIPLTREELDEKLANITLSDDESIFIERFYGTGKEVQT